MPNWTTSQLKITGDKKELQRFKKFSHTEVDEYGGKRTNVLDTNVFIPYPKKFLDITKEAENHNEKMKTERKIPENKMLIELGDDNFEHMSDGFNQGGYEWCSSNWGSKWGISSPEIAEEEDNCIEYHFQSAWSPVFPVINKMTKLFPTLTFEYACQEESNAFDFVETYKNEETLKSVDKKIERGEDEDEDE